MCFLIEHVECILIKLKIVKLFNWLSEYKPGYYLFRERKILTIIYAFIKRTLTRRRCPSTMTDFCVDNHKIIQVQILNKAKRQLIVVSGRYFSSKSKNEYNHMPSVHSRVFFGRESIKVSCVNYLSTLKNVDTIVTIYSNYLNDITNKIAV